MSSLYRDYYAEIPDDSGNIRIEINCPKNFNFAYDVVDRYSTKWPDKVALVHRNHDGVTRRYTFGELKVMSDRAANVLRKNGVKKGDAVMLLLKRRYEFWVCILAIHKLGAVAIPTSHMVSSEDIGERLALSRARMVICVNADDICDRVKEAIGGRNVCQLVVGKRYNGAVSFDEEMEAASGTIDRVEVNSSDDMLYYFTSGTNGSPKAVIHDFSYPLAHIYTAKNWHGVVEDGLHLTVADSGWAKSAWGKLYGQWLMGTAVMVYDYDQFYAWDLLRVIEEEKINTFCAPPTIYKYLVLEDFSRYRLGSLRHVTTAGEPMPAQVATKFMEKTGLVIREGFGQTETALQICTPCFRNQVKGSIGVASPLYKIDLVDEDGNSVPDGQEGEIVIVPENGRTLGVFKGYLGDDALYKEVFAGGVYHTRDKAVRDGDGSFFFLGRSDDVIKSSGYRIGPSEVEDVIMRHPAVFECAVTGYPSKSRGAVVKASIILKSGYEPDEQLGSEIQDYVRKRVAIYKYPRIIKFVKDLPRTGNGKISRALIRKMDYHKS